MNEPPTKFNENSSAFQVGCGFLVSGVLMGIMALVITYGESTFTAVWNYFADASPEKILSTFCLVCLVLGVVLMVFSVESDTE